MRAHLTIYLDLSGCASFRIAARIVLAFGTGISTGAYGLPSLSLPLGCVSWVGSGL
jgi:hypothetical protein